MYTIPILFIIIIIWHNDNTTAFEVIKSLFKNVRLQQCRENRLKVEKNIDDIVKQLGNNKKYTKPIANGSYRTVWTSVTASSFLGTLFKQFPDRIVGGASWQCIDGNNASNLVYWPSLGLRMVGLAMIKPFSSTLVEGYELIIKGLEFRWGVGKGIVPESRYPIEEKYLDIIDKCKFNLFTLPEGKELR